MVDPASSLLPAAIVLAESGRVWNAKVREEEL
jgi:hypothetical protein